MDRRIAVAGHVRGMGYARRMPAAANHAKSDDFDGVQPEIGKKGGRFKGSRPRQHKAEILWVAEGQGEPAAAATDCLLPIYMRIGQGRDG